MRTSIPEEIKQARRIIQEKERILAQAQADASGLLTRAREETERAMNREGLLRVAEQRSHDMVQQATEHAQQMVRSAEEHCEQLKNDADGYAMETLRNLREHLLSVETDIARTVLSIERGIDSLEEQPAPVDSYSDMGCAMVPAACDLKLWFIAPSILFIMKVLSEIRNTSAWDIVVLYEAGLVIGILVSAAAWANICTPVNNRTGTSKHI